MRFTRWLPFATPILLGLLATPSSARAQAASGYAGSAACVECHRKETATFAATTKGTLFLKHPETAREKLGCEGCHGPAKQHAESGGEERGGLITFNGKNPSPVADRNAVCLQCHEKTARMMWKGSAHELRDVACTDCHSVMQQVSDRGNLKKASVLETCGSCHPERKSQQLRFAHMPVGENKIECTSCHNPHGSAAPKLLVASSVNEVCYQCHAEKRGPYLWEHAPVTENCANCHDPHGSSHEKMLKVSRPRLCQQCHAGTGHPIQARNPNLLADQQFLMNRQCQNCHVNIHGSNHPSGFAFTR